MSDDFDRFEHLSRRGSGVHGGIAGEIAPNGAQLVCTTCGEARAITQRQVGSYLSSGWPKHCGYTMRFEPVAAVSRG